MFQGKRILFISPNFFGYADKITLKLRELNAVVDVFDERPANSFFVKASLRISKFIVKGKISRYYSFMLKQTETIAYDFVFIIDPEAIDQKILARFKLQQPQAKFILYLWDSIKNKQGRQQLIRYFDKVYSFDRFDCLSNKNLIFRPLFFLNSLIAVDSRTAYKYDVTFIGTIHSDRYKILRTVAENAKNKDLKVYFYMYLQGRIMYFYRKYITKEIDGSTMEDFQFVPIQSNTVNSIMEASRCILDIQHPKQTGLTIRTLEALGAQRKLITTNQDIVNYDFYSPDNIFVIDRNRPVITETFLAVPFRPIGENIMKKYSLEGWLNEIFG